MISKVANVVATIWLCAVATIAHAECPVPFSGAYGGLLHTFSFNSAKAFTEKSSAVGRFVFDGFGGLELSAHNKTSAAATGEVMTRTGTYVFYESLCAGTITLNGGNSVYGFVVTDSGNEINIALFNDTNLAEHDSMHGVLRRY